MRVNLLFHAGQHAFSHTEGATTDGVAEYQHFGIGVRQITNFQWWRIVKEAGLFNLNQGQIRGMGDKFNACQIAARIAVLLHLHIAGIRHYMRIGQNSVAFDDRTRATALIGVHQTPGGEIVGIGRRRVDFDNRVFNFAYFVTGLGVGSAAGQNQQATGDQHCREQQPSPGGDQACCSHRVSSCVRVFYYSGGTEDRVNPKYCPVVKCCLCQALADSPALSDNTHAGLSTTVRAEQINVLAAGSRRQHHALRKAELHLAWFQVGHQHGQPAFKVLWFIG